MNNFDGTQIKDIKPTTNGYKVILIDGNEVHITKETLMEVLSLFNFDVNMGRTKMSAVFDSNKWIVEKFGEGIVY